MAEHHLKTVQPYFDAVVRGEKTFELRVDDRGFDIGDVLVLEEYMPDRTYSGRSVRRVVTYVLRGAALESFGYGFGNKCIMALAPVVDSEDPIRAFERAIVMRTVRSFVAWLRKEADMVEGSGRIAIHRLMADHIEHTIEAWVDRELSYAPSMRASRGMWTEARTRLIQYRALLTSAAAALRLAPATPLDETEHYAGDVALAEEIEEALRGEV